MPLTYTVKQGDTLNSIASQYGFANYKDAGITSVPSGNFDLIRPGESVTLSNYKKPVQQTTTDMRSTATANTAKLEQRTTQLAAATQGAEVAKPSQVSVTRDQDNGDGTRTVTYSDGTTARVQATKNADGSESYKELNQTESMAYDTQRATAKHASDVAYANETLDSIKKLSSATTAALVDNIKRTYQAKVKLMEDSNKRLLGAKTQVGIKSGRSRYASEIQAGILSDEENAGLARIGQLEGEMYSLILEAEQAQTDKDLEIFNARMSALDQADKELRQTVQNLQTNAFNKLQEERLRAKAESDAAHQELQDQLDKSERSAPGVLKALSQFTSPEDQQAFIEEYARKSGIPVDVLLGDIETAASDQQKAELDFENIKNQILTRSQNAATSKRNADIAAGRLALDQEKQLFNPSSEERAKVGKYLAKYGDDNDTKRAQEEPEFFYKILDLAEQEEL